jgi:uncharacterized protein (DUF1499 family)
MKTIVIVLASVVAFSGYMVVKNMTQPAGLGVADGRLAPMPKSPNAVSTQAVDERKKVAPFPFKSDLQETQEAIRSILRAYGGIQIVQDERLYIHAVSTTSTMRFHDDLEFYFDEEKGIVHFRSASRVGYSDMGLNRKRYNSLIESYKGL